MTGDITPKPVYTGGALSSTAQTLVNEGLGEFEELMVLVYYKMLFFLFKLGLVGDIFNGEC